MVEIGTDLDRAAKYLENEQLVAVPTETVYGLAGNALSENAILSIYKVKKRPSFDPLIAHIGHLDQVKSLAINVPEKLQGLIESYWPGPLTILLKKSETVPDILTSGLNRVAVRMPAHSMTLSLLEKVGFPLAAPSANPFGYVSPTTAIHVENQLGSSIPYILDGGDCQIGLESTIVGIENEEVVVYRLGGLPVEKIEEIVGQVKVHLNQSSNPVAPGMLKSHYAPKKRLILGNIEVLLKKYEHVGVLSFKEKYDAKISCTLSADGNLEEAAKNLFGSLRMFDDTAIDAILAEEVPDIGIGKAINDRLRRAAV
ncbi:MAG: L-threonylcarbamoyladenylate synthase [Bacteroidota bacterium]